MSFGKKNFKTCALIIGEGYGIIDIYAFLQKRKARGYK